MLNRCKHWSSTRAGVIAAMTIGTDLAGKVSLAILGASIERSGFEEAVMFTDSIDR